MKIAILGGSFDPPHIGHILIAEQVREILNMDQIWLMPNFKHAFAKAQTPILHRKKMVNLIQSDLINFSELEINREGISYTIDTLTSLTTEFRLNEFFWILGSDQLESFQKYKNWKKIVANHNLIIFPRESIITEIESKVKKFLDLKSLPENIIILNNPDLVLTNISSTVIRERVKENKSIKYMVPEVIEKYIFENKLYEK